MGNPAGGEAGSTIPDVSSAAGPAPLCYPERSHFPRVRMLPLPSSSQCHYTVAFSPCGRWLAAGGSSYAVDVWDLHAPQTPARRLQDLAGSVVRAAFATDGRLVVVSTGWLACFE